MPFSKRVLAALASLISSLYVIFTISRFKVTPALSILSSLFSLIMIISATYLIYKAYVTIRYYMLKKGRIVIGDDEISFRYSVNHVDRGDYTFTIYEALTETRKIKQEAWYIEFMASSAPLTHDMDTSGISERYNYAPAINEVPVSGHLYLQHDSYPLLFYRVTECCECPVASKCTFAMYNCRHTFKVGETQMMLVTAKVAKGTRGGGHKKGKFSLNTLLNKPSF